MFQRRPDIHGHRVGVVQEEGAGLGDLSDIFTERQDLGNVALAIHDTAGAECIAHTLIDPIFQRYVDVELEGAQTPYARDVQDVVGAFERLASVDRSGELCRKLVRLDVSQRQL